MSEPVDYAALKAEFLRFCGALEVETKELGLVKLGETLLGSQTYFVDEIFNGLAQDIHYFVVLKGRQLGCCLRPDSKVLTADLRWVPIEQCRVGDEVVATDEDIQLREGRHATDRKMRTARIEAVREVNEPCIELTMENGVTLRATAEHRFLSKRRGGSGAHWRTVAKMRVGDEIRYITSPWGDTGYEDGWIGGIIDGEGSMDREATRNGVRCSISQVAGDVLDRIRAYFVDRRYTPRAEQIDNREAGKSSKLGNKTVYKVVIARMDELFRLMGQSRPSRFINKRWWEGKSLPGKNSGIGYSRIIDVKLSEEPQRMIDLQTSTQTFICEGFVSHNSTICMALDLFWIFRFPGMQGTLACDTEETRELFRTTLTMYMNGLPQRWRQPDDAHNRTHLVLKNRSRLSYQVAGTRKNVGFGAGKALAYAHSTEVGKWGDGTDLSSFEASFAETNPNRLYIFESTAYGFGPFYDMWETATTAVSQRAIFIGWWRNELYRVKKDSEIYKVYWDGRLTTEEKTWVNEVKELYEFDIDDEQIAWHRWTLNEKMKADEQMMHEKYPACVTAETRVGTRRGIVRIDQAKVGDTATLGNVTSTHATKLAHIFKMTTRMGYSVRGTADHPIFKPDGSLVQLSAALGETIVLQPPITSQGLKAFVNWADGPAHVSVEIDTLMARFVGIFMGDGSFSIKRAAVSDAGCGTLSIACCAEDDDFIKETVSLIGSLFGLAAQVRDVSSGGKEIRVSATMLTRVFKNMGLLRNDTGVTMRRVHVPEFIWQSRLKVIREFLSGVFETDGFVSRDGYNIVLASKYHEFMADIQVLLLAFGITCRLTTGTSTATVRGVKHSYKSSRLTLRKNESRLFASQIGFLSERKKQRSIGAVKRLSGARAFEIQMQDEVVSVVEDGFEPVYNLSVDGENAFDANGIKTHNTAEYAFIMSGSQFFSAQRLTDQTKIVRGKPYDMRRFVFGAAFEDTELVDCNERTATLKIWQQPVPKGQYVLGCDPAWGSSEWADRFAISVNRCWADGVEQVAEFCTPELNTMQFAWVMLYLAGAYGDPNLQANVMINLEINGPGQAVWSEVTTLKQRAAMVKEGSNLSRVLQNIQNYLYRRPDSVQGGYAYHTKTSASEKERFMNILKDHHEFGTCVINSVECLAEMKNVVREDGQIGVPGRGKDDRVIAQALAVLAWSDFVRSRLIQMGITKAKQKAEAEMPPELVTAGRSIENYLRHIHLRPNPRTMRR